MRRLIDCNSLIHEAKSQARVGSRAHLGPGPPTSACIARCSAVRLPNASNHYEENHRDIQPRRHNASEA